MGMGGAMGGVAGFVCVMCAAATALAAPEMQNGLLVERVRLLPDTVTVASSAVVAELPGLRVTELKLELELDASVQRMLRLGFTIADMHAIPVASVPLRYGLPVDEQAFRDDRVNLTADGRFAVGTLMLLQRDATAFRELAGRQYFRDDAVTGLKFFPVAGVPVHVGVGLLVSMDRYDESSALFGRPFLATSQVGVRF